MSVSLTNFNVIYSCNGALTSFNRTQDLLDNAHLKVYLIEIATGLKTLLASGVDYSLVGGNPATSITTTLTYSALYQIELRRETPKTQSSNFDVGQTYISERVEDSVDKLSLIVQELHGRDAELQLDIDDLLDDALAAQAAAEAAQLAAETAQTAAELAETNAETAETNAETAETNAEAAQIAAEAAQANAEFAEAGAEAAKIAAENLLVGQGFTTGDVKLTIKTVADTGWVLMNDTTIGNASSGATGRANADTQALFELLWTNTANADCAVSTGRGASAAADFASNKTIALPKALGRALATYGSGSGLTARAMAAIIGNETHALSADENGLHTHVQNAHTHTQDAHTHTQNSHLHSVTGRGVASGDHYHNTSSAPSFISTAGNGGSEGTGSSFASGASTDSTTATNQNATATNQNATATNQNSGLGNAHNNMQPTLFLNVMIKL